jgi:hypothetical protein
VSPPLTMTADDLDELAAGLAAAVDDVEAGR